MSDPMSLADALAEAFRFDRGHCFRCRTELPQEAEPPDGFAPPRWCDVCLAVIAAENAERDRIEAERRLAAVLRAMRIPERFTWATFDAPELADRVRNKVAIEQAAKLVGARSSVVLVGGAGSGKTSLACAMLRGIGAGVFVGAYWIAKARQEHPLGESEAPDVARAIAVPVLVLDDLGQEQARNTAIQEVIYERHAHGRRTIATTGFGFRDLIARYGEGIARRLTEGASIVRCGKPPAGPRDLGKATPAREGSG